MEISLFLAECFKREYSWRILEDICSQEYIQFFDMQVASPFVCTSPLAVKAVTAVLEIRTVSNCAEFKSFQLSMDIAAPESTINCLSPLGSLRMELAYTKVH